MNTSYNYADFIGLNIYDKRRAGTGVNGRTKQKSRRQSVTGNGTRLNTESDKDKTAE